jgi:endonuclease YncB( thermonuclease family)
VADSGGRVGWLPGKQVKDRYGRTSRMSMSSGANLEAQMLADGLGFQVAWRRTSILLPVSRLPNSRASGRGCGGRL